MVEFVAELKPDVLEARWWLFAKTAESGSLGMRRGSDHLRQLTLCCEHGGTCALQRLHRAGMGKQLCGRRLQEAFTTLAATSVQISEASGILHCD